MSSDRLPINTSVMSSLDGPDQDKVILGVKARDWKKEYLDQVLAKAVECEENKSDSMDSSGSVKKAQINYLKNDGYRNWIASIERRDQYQQQKLDREASRARSEGQTTVLCLIQG